MPYIIKFKRYFHQKIFYCEHEHNEMKSQPLEYYHYYNGRWKSKSNERKITQNKYRFGIFSAYILSSSMH